MERLGQLSRGFMRVQAACYAGRGVGYGRRVREPRRNVAQPSGAVGGSGRVPPRRPSLLPCIAPSLLDAFAAERTDAYRVASAAAGWIERLGEDALVCFKSDGARRQLLDTLSGFPWKPRRVFGKLVSRGETAAICPQLWSGDASLPMETEACEGGVLYGIDFAAGYSHGLFLDQRANRAALRRRSPRRVLNTFAYTCSFSVVAALAGAETLSVDLSKKSLERGRANFARNGLDPSSGHRFVADDVLDVLPRLARRGEKFDVVILDPPTFSRSSKGRVWKAEEDFAALLDATLLLVDSGARILLSTNSTLCDLPALERLARDGLQAFGRSATFRRESRLPDFPAGQGAVTLWIELR